jgi:hypothetical protein
MTKTTFTFGSLALALLPLVGCGLSEGPIQGLGGGAYTPSEVTLIVSNTAGGGAESEGTGGDSGGAAAVAGFGVLKGKVVIDGAAPTLNMLLAKGAATKDAVCSINGVPDESVVSAGGGLGNVFVYLKKVPKGVAVPPLPTEKIIFDQKGCFFVPHAFVAHVGQPINITNNDPVAHNVHTFSNNRALNSAIQGNDTKGMEMAYDKAEGLPIKTVCDFHAWMDSYHLVVDHPWATLTAPDGTFEIKGVPAGKMEFVVWHEKVGYVERSLKVDIVPDQTTEANGLKVAADKLVKK